MHVQHHLPPPPELNTRSQTRKPADEEDSKAYSHLSNLSDEERRKGSDRQPPSRRDPDQPRQPTSSGLLRPKPRALGVGKPAPFMAVTSVTEFWTELVMATKDEGLDDGDTPPAVQAAPSNQPSLLDLFAKAVK